MAPDSRGPAQVGPLFVAGRAIEFVLVFGGGPLLILGLHRAGTLFGLLWVGAAVAWRATRGRQPRPHDPRRETVRLLLRFAVLAPVITLATWWLLPQAFLSLPRQRPQWWCVIMVLYPLLSVWPQEMLYRAFLFARYETLLGERGAVLASALAFGYAHVIFQNWVAVAMTTVGGWLFAADYARHRSLRLSCLEHSLYGCLIFTVGLGRFFYTGTAWHHGG